MIQRLQQPLQFLFFFSQKDSLGAAVVLVAMLLALLVHRCHPDHLTPGQVGLAISYTLMTPIYLQWVVRFWSELEMYFNAVERVLHYSQLRSENESAASSAASTVLVDDGQWPRKGDMEIVHLSVTYHHSLEPVIRDLSLTIRHGQKVGICGRTGSGKSTLVNAIFRLADMAAGCIKLNGIDIASLEPHYLRSRLSAVPQDTLIIVGTLRYYRFTTFYHVGLYNADVFTKCNFHAESIHLLLKR